MARHETTWKIDDGAAGTLTLRVHVQPGAKHTAVAGIHGERLKIRLAAPPVDGKANAALVAFLADIFGVPLRNIELLAGASSRRKTVLVREATRRPDREWEASPVNE